MRTRRLSDGSRRKVTRGVDLRYVRLETSSYETHKRIAIGAKDLLPDSPPTAGASIGGHGSRLSPDRR
jgi:hypothetical protein